VEEIVHRYKNSIIVLTLVFVCVFMWFGCGDDDDKSTNSNSNPTNQAPVIDSITASNDTIDWFMSTMVIVYAHDPDSGSLSYGWEAHSTGSWLTAISGSGNIKQFGSCCDASYIKSGEVVAIVSDNQGGTTKDSITIWLKPD
jgi:hypothetical protein